MYRLRPGTPSRRRTDPQPALRIRSEGPRLPGVPKLLAAYLSIGARICGPPAIDRDFKTIDFLTFLDLRRSRRTSFGSI
jgi:putative hemolysin